MVVGAAPVRAGLLPVAGRAVVDRLRVGLRRCGGVGFEPPADGAVVRRVLHDPEARPVPPGASAERQVHPLRFHALHPRQQVRVQENLQQRRALCAAGQLRVEHLVRPAAQRALPVHPEQEVGVAAPAAVVVRQASLVDDVGPAPHRVPRPRGRRSRVPLGERSVGRGDGLHGASVGRELFQEPLFVIETALSQHLGARVVVRGRRIDLAERDGAAQARQVAAGEVAAEVGGREGESAGGVAHRARP